MSDKKPSSTSGPKKLGSIKKQGSGSNIGKKTADSKNVKSLLEVPNPLTQRQISPEVVSTPSPTASGSTSSSSGNVKVICRVRPFNPKEAAMGGTVCVDFVDKKTIAIKTAQDFGSATNKFTFDRVFDMRSTQQEVYELAAKPVVDSVLEGFNGTVFAYGQTSSGKTHTMLGPDVDSERDKGIIPRMVNTVFEHINGTPGHVEFTVKVAMVEIYMEKIRDLLSPEKHSLKIREDRARGIYIEDVTEAYVSQDMEVYELMKLGNTNRAISATNMNEGSSRSHSIFMLTIHQNNLQDLSAKTGKLYLVDLAGSEKIAKTGAAGQVLEEAKKINKSLSSLGNVINALTESKSHQHIPYRDSKLTRILQESLGGNSKTTLIITCSPSGFNDLETLSTLRFGHRAKSIKNKPKINREFTVPELQLMLEKAETLIEKQKARIKLLEKTLKEKGITLPKESAAESSGKDRPDEDNDDLREELDRQEKLMESKFAEMAKAEDSIKVRVLENELVSERANVRTQTEKLSIIQEEFELVNAKLITSEKENEALIQRLANLTLEQQEQEENEDNKDTKLQVLMSLKDALIAENEELRASNQYLLQRLETRDQNTEAPNASPRLKSISQKLKSKSSYEDLKGKGKLERTPSERKEDERANLELIGAEIAKKLAKEFKIGNEELLKDVIRECIESTKDISQGEKARRLEEQSDLKLKRLQDNLDNEKGNRVRMEKEYEKLVEEYDKIAKGKVADFDQIKQKIVNEIAVKERNRYEKDKELILRDLQNRVDKVVELEILLDEQKDKNNNLEGTMSEGEKALRKKNKALEHNLEQVTHMYHQIVAQQSMLSLDSQVNERKLQRKVERIYSLEKQLSEIKETLTYYKRANESLKAVITVSNTASIPVNQILSDNWESIEGLQQYKDSIKEEILGEIIKPAQPKELVSPRKSIGTPITSKIVKHIRGGSKNTAIAPLQKAKSKEQDQSLSQQSVDVSDYSSIKNYSKDSINLQEDSGKKGSNSKNSPK